MIDNLALSNRVTKAVVKRTNRDDQTHAQSSYAVSLDATALTWKVPFMTKAKDKTFPTERLVLITSANSRLSKDGKWLNVSECFDDFGVTVRIDFGIKVEVGALEFPNCAMHEARKAGEAVFSGYTKCPHFYCGKCLDKHGPDCGDCPEPDGAYEAQE